MLEIVSGNLLESSEKYVCHQVNAVSNRAAGLALSVFTKFPYADIYKSRQGLDQPGTIIVRGDGAEQRYVINLVGQIYPGSPKFPDSPKDGHKAREQYFYQALKQIILIPNLTSIAFPFGIGCGLAGGNWEMYYRILSNFASAVENKATVRIFKLEE